MFSNVRQKAKKSHEFRRNTFALLLHNTVAALHFNYNLRWETKQDSQGQPKLSVTYPKYKEGEATVREARVPPSYGNSATIGTCTTPGMNIADY